MEQQQTLWLLKWQILTNNNDNSIAMTKKGAEATCIVILLHAQAWHVNYHHTLKFSSKPCPIQPRELDNTAETTRASLMTETS